VFIVLSHLPTSLLIHLSSVAADLHNFSISFRSRVCAFTTPA